MGKNDAGRATTHHTQAGECRAPGGMTAPSRSGPRESNKTAGQPGRVCECCRQVEMTAPVAFFSPQFSEGLQPGGVADAS